MRLEQGKSAGIQQSEYTRPDYRFDIALVDRARIFNLLCQKRPLLAAFLADLKKIDRSCVPRLPEMPCHRPKLSLTERYCEYLRDRENRSCVPCLSEKPVSWHIVVAFRFYPNDRIFWKKTTNPNNNRVFLKYIKPSLKRNIMP